MIHPKLNIERLSACQPPWQGLDRTQYLRLDLNEYTKGLPEHVKKALKRFIDEDRIPLYPDYCRFLLKLALYTNVDKDRLLITNGSDQAIEIILRAFLWKNDRMMMAWPGFPMFTHIAKVIGAYVKGIPYTADLHFPYKEFVNAITEEIRLIVLINPDNPTGVSLSLEEIKGILDRACDIPVIIDEAYFEFTGKTALSLLDLYPNLIITRTFSKAFALAGLRLGYIIANPQLIAQFSKVRGPFDINNCALVAAEAQLDFPFEWQDYVQETMTISKPFIERFFNEHNVPFYSGGAHFMLVKPKNRDKAVQFLKEHGILVRPIMATPVDKTFRMNVGTMSQMKQFVTVYKKYLSEVECEREGSNALT